MTQPRLFTIDREGRGLLSTMACPDGAEQLSPFMSALKARGVGVVVSLLPIREEARLGLAKESSVAGLVGIEFRWLPTRDFRAPELGAAKSLASDVADRLAAGQHVVIHCRGGVGRSSTLAAAVLVHEGLSAEESWQRIVAARGTHVPETRSQRTLIGRLDATQPP